MTTRSLWSLVLVLVFLLPLTVEGQTPEVMESWNIDWTRQHDPFTPKPT